MPCRAEEFSNWDRLFIALEDSHMRQNVLLDSLGQCCGGMVSLRMQLDKLVKGKGLPNLESVCRLHVEQARVRLQQDLLELREEETRREMNLNETMEQLLHRSHEGNLLLKRLEDSWGRRGTPMGEAESKMRHQPTQAAGGLGQGYGSGTKPASPLLKEKDVTSLLDTATVRRALVAIATELQTVHLQLSRVIEQVGTPRKDRGDI